MKYLEDTEIFLVEMFTYTENHITIFYSKKSHIYSSDKTEPISIVIESMWCKLFISVKYNNIGTKINNSLFVLCANSETA